MKLSKHQNQIWQECWNYQTMNFKKKTMINMLRDLMDNIDNIQEQMGNINKERKSEDKIIFFFLIDITGDRFYAKQM